MASEEFGDSERKFSYEEESRVEVKESDNEWQFTSVPEEESEIWKVEKDKYNEVIEYIREIDEILNLIKPFPREESTENRGESFVRTEFPKQVPRFGLNHLENIIKLVEQLKELKENSYKSSERTFFLKDLKKLREHKMRLKSEEVEMKTRTGTRSMTASDECEICSLNRKNSSTSEKLEQEPKENWQADKRKSVCLGENRSKVSKWTKVKEAFYWEKTSVGSKILKRENSTGEKNLPKEECLKSREVSPGELGVKVFGYPPPPPPPTPPPPPLRPAKTEDSLFVRTAQDFPSSSSSDKLDDVFSYSNVKVNNTSDSNSLSHSFLPDGTEETETTMRKSSCEELAQHLIKESGTGSTKSNKTTWSKVKNIIQTRKDSLKKKPKKRASDECKKRRKLSTVSNAQSSDQFEDLSSPEDRIKTMEIIPKSVHNLEVSPPSIEKTCTKSLVPALAVTLPSAEEFGNLSLDNVDRRENTEEDRMNILSQLSCEAQYCEDKSKFGKNKSGSNQRLSRWIKVKRVFLTSTPVRSTQDFPVGTPSPTSQNKLCGFFSDLESDDFSSGEWMDDKSPSLEKAKPSCSESQSTAMTIIQEDIRKSYNELQKKLSQEFDQKLKEWEVKIETPSNSAAKEELVTKLKGDDGDTIPKFRKTRDSITVPLPNLNDLSPEFKKRLNDWKKMKTSQSSSSMASSVNKDEIQGQNIKIRLGEWQPWKNRYSGKGVAKGEQGLAEDLPAKFEEEQKGSKSSRLPANRRKDDEEGLSGSTIRRGSNIKSSVKKLRHSRTPSGGERLVSAEENSGTFIRRSQKVKDFHWVEKELQKIEKEKLRLDQEKEKYLEREARLEKMKKTMGTSPTQEILVRTPEGFFRFKGISQKFTKKLYEWEKARGIAPEASTFALLEESVKTGLSGDVDADGVTMQRSKSTGSVPELSSNLLIQTMAHHPSSLSLNDVDELKLKEEESISLDAKDANEEPDTTIVDVEDFEEETAVLVEGPPFQSETPVYTDAAEEIDQKNGSRGRFYLSGELGFEIIKENDVKMSVGIFDVSRDPKNRYRETKLRVRNNERKELKNSKDNFLQPQEEDVILEDVAERFQAEKEKKILGEQLHLSKILTRGYINPKTKGIYKPNVEKFDSSEVAGEIDLPELQHQRGFLKWTEKSQEVISPPKMETEELSFDGKSAQEISQTKSDPQALKRNIKEKITLTHRISTEGNWRCTDFDFRKSYEKKKTLKEENNKSQKLEKKTNFEEDLQGVFQPDEEAPKKNESISVFVQTSRKIISPVKRSDDATPSICSYIIDDVKSDSPETLEKNVVDQTSHSSKSFPETQDDLHVTGSPTSALQNKTDLEFNQKRDIGIPPLPNSPKVHKKLNPKETAPSIRMIIAKYNQKILEHDNAEGKKTESGSPIWRSPVFGRRTQEKIEKFGGIKDGEVLKSASLDNMRTRTSRSSLSPPQEFDPKVKGILKSSSMGFMRTRPQNQESDISVIPITDTVKETSPSVLRAKKIQKAKEDFLSGRLVGSSDISNFSIPTELLPETEAQIKITEGEIEIEQGLTKSLSTEIIADNSGGRDCQSDVRLLEKSPSKFDISNIKSKFRKMRMRKEKDTKLNAVAILCRQSLFIEVPKVLESSSTSKSCPSSPIMDRNKSEKTIQPSEK